jgi:hypothetical protein
MSLTMAKNVQLADVVAKRSRLSAPQLLKLISELHKW